MKNLVKKNNLLKPAKVGEIVEGKVIGKGRFSIFLDLGTMGTGIIYGKEFQEAKDQLKNLKTGDRVLAKIINLENEEGYIELSISRAFRELTWAKLQQKKEKGEQIKVKILGANKGGLITEVFGIAAFLPVSQLEDQHYPRLQPARHPLPEGRPRVDTSKILRELQKFIGKELEVKIFDLSPKEEKLILSEKAKTAEKIKEILKNYKIGDVVEGEISGITDFGAFMKFLPAEARRPKEGPSLKKERPAFAEAPAEESEALEGLIHISELDWRLIEDPAEIVKVGQKVKAKIINISDNKVSLSSKALKKDPWLDIEKKYKKGGQVSGKVTKFNPFGALVQITPKIQGLCHISEFGTRGKMEEILKIGSRYNFQILEIRPKEHKMSLKLVE